jgi:AcrR family transcriptional regulator
MNENTVISLVKAGIVTTTFRKLEPDKKELIYRSGLKEFSADVFDRVSLDKIARTAGISKGSLIQYFRHKENLLIFISEIFLTEYERYWDDYFAREHPVRARDRIAAYLMARFDYWEKDRTEFNFCMKMQYENGINISRRLRERIMALRSKHTLAIIERGIATGEIRGDIELETMALIIQAVSRNLEIAYQASLGASRGKINIKEITERLSTLIFDGISG